jgi:GNAT superfamily N-acetyltransferase
MADLLVKLYDLPPAAPALETLAREGIEIRRAIGPEKHAVTEWAGEKFSRAWAAECDVAMSGQPVTCFIAVKDGKVLGFACYDSTLKGFFGPIGVDPDTHGKGLGKALLLRTLEAMRDAGYGYAAIGWAGPVDFFKKTVGAVVIEGSEPGVYRNLVKTGPKRK